LKIQYDRDIKLPNSLSSEAILFLGGNMKKSIVFSTLFALTTGTAFAKEQSPYALVSLGVSQADLNEVTSRPSTNKSEESFAWKVSGGYQFNPNFALEAGYIDFGKFSETISVSSFDKVDVDFKAHALFISALGIVPLNESFDLFGKAGLARSEVKASTNVVMGPGMEADLNSSGHGTSPAFGLGGEYSYNQNVSLRGEVEYFIDVGDADSSVDFDVAMATVGVKYSF